MSKRSVFTTITPLPPGVTREIVMELLRNHVEMIDLNPLVTERHPIYPPPHSPPEESKCVWYSLTDKISYLPGGRANGSVSYTCAFHDLPNGLQTHVYAPMGLDIQDKWTLAGSLPGEPSEPMELGLGAPRQGLYIREDVDMRCNIVMASFVKKTLKKAHAVLVDRLKEKANAASRETDIPVGPPQQRYRTGSVDPVSHRAVSPAGSDDTLVSNTARHCSYSIRANCDDAAIPAYKPYSFSPEKPLPPPPQSYAPALPIQGPEPSSAYPSSAYPDPLRISPFYSIRNSQGNPSWQPLKPSMSVVSRYPGAKDQDYSEFTDMNPYSDEKTTGDVLPPRHNSPPRAIRPMAAPQVAFVAELE